MTPLNLSSDRVRRTLTPLLALTLALPAFAQVANKPATPAAEEKPAVKVEASGAPAKEGVLELSPFVVSTQKDQGYFAENTLAGSRLNSNLADLAASITVVTKQQLDDTASLDINDVFRYEAGTEGSGTYTPQITDRGTLKDSVGGYSFGNNGDTTTNAQSNRVRGLSAPDASINYHPSNSRIPFDSYNIQSVEIARGPNSLLFGLGSPAGIVNQSSAQAVINRNSNSISLRTDHLGSQRASFAINRSLIEDKLAIYIAGLYNNQQFERKPSYELTKRQFGAITYRPFPKTVIRAFAENYDNKANRPNFITPRDMVSPWLAAGRPSYDPVTRTIKFMDATSYPKNSALAWTGTNMVNRAAGEVIGPIYFDTRSPGSVATIVSGTTRLVGAALLTNSLSPYYLPYGLGFDTGNTNTLERFDNGTQIDYFTRTIGFFAPAHTNPATATPSNSSWAVNDPRFLITDRNWTASTTNLSPILEANGKIYTYSTYQAPGVSDKAIYDYTSINLNQPNFGTLKAGNYNIEVEQQITDDLFFSAGWYRQQLDAAENYILSQLQGNTLQVDTNLNKMDGSANPYYGLAYVPLGLGGGVDTFFSPETNDSYRAMLAYNLDFTKQNGWAKWLGRHRLLGLVAEQDTNRNRERWRLTYVNAGDTEGTLRYGRNLTLDGQANWSAAAIRKAYYAASPGDPQGTVTHSLGFYGNPGSESLYTPSVNVYNINDGVFRNVKIGERIAYSDAGSANFQREVKSWTLATQSYLWNDRLVLTLGWRNDKYRARNTTTGSINALDGTLLTPALTANQLYPYKTGEANYDLIMHRWTVWDKLEGDTKTLGAAFRPLSGWNKIESSANNGNIVSDFLRGLTLYYNQSDNFNPPPSKQTDYFKKQLPKPTGEGKDGGFGFNLFNNKLVARVNWFQTENQNERTSAAGTLLTRLAYSDTTTGYSWAAAVTRIRNAVAAGVPLATYVAQTNWNDNAVYSVDDAANQQKIYDLLKLPLNYYAGIQLGATQQSIAKGVEVQITYNPTRNWTMKFTATKAKSTYTDVAPQYDEWLAQRMPVWESLGVSDIPDFVSNGREYSLKNFWNGYGFNSVALKENLNGLTSPKAYFDQVVQSEVALAKALEGAIAPNQRIYHLSFLTNYTFGEGRWKGFAVGGAQRWESKAAVGYYGKAANPNSPTLINASDTTRPVYLDNGNFYTDLWASYTRRIFNDKVRMKIQLNVNNVTEGGGLLPVAVNWDGKPWGFRIVDPRQFILTTSFDF